MKEAVSSVFSAMFSFFPANPADPDDLEPPGPLDGQDHQSDPRRDSIHQSTEPDPNDPSQNQSACVPEQIRMNLVRMNHKQFRILKRNK